MKNKTIFSGEGRRCRVKKFSVMELVVAEELCGDGKGVGLHIHIRIQFFLLRKSLKPDVQI